MTVDDPVPFRLLDHTDVAAEAFLVLARETWDTPDGPVARVVVHHPGAVVAVPVDGDDVLFVRQFRTAVRRHLVEIPAGKRDVAGEPPEDAIIRELEEEIGMRPGRLTRLAEFYNSPGFCDEHTHLFLATDLAPVHATGPLRAEEREMRIERVPLPEAVRRVGAGEITDAKTIVGLLLAARALGVTA